MEVHHPNHPTHKKNWKEYLVEFFMLFLAVFLGFLAENLREGYVEKHRAQQYMRSLVEDLKRDTANIQFVINLAAIVSKKTDSVVDLVNNGIEDAGVVTFYRLHAESLRVLKVGYEDRTSSQLKNSGSLRMVKNSKIADAIRAYWETIKQIENISNAYNEFGGKTTDVGVQIFNNKFYQKGNANNPFNIVIDPLAKLADNNPKLLVQYSNRKRTQWNILNSYQPALMRSKAEATDLIALINNEYHFK